MGSSLVDVRDAVPFEPSCAVRRGPDSKHNPGLRRPPPRN